MYWLLSCLVCFYASHVTNAFRCGLKYIEVEPVGCYKEQQYGSSMLDRLLTKMFDEKWHREVIEEEITDPFRPVTGPVGSLKDFVCECAQEANAGDYQYFGVKSRTSCYSGKTARKIFDKPPRPKGQCDVESENGDRKCPAYSGKFGMNTMYIYRIRNKCHIDFDPIGCFKDKKPRGVPNYAMNERDKTDKNYNNRSIEWKNWNNYYPGFICRCAEEAKKLRHDIFAIQYFGECWTGTKEESLYDRYGESNKCKGAGYKQCRSCQSCVGTENTNYVYKMRK